MIQKYLVADLSDTALVIECAKCKTALVVPRPEPKGVEFRPIYNCTNCQAALFPDIEGGVVQPQAVIAWRAFLAIAETIGSRGRVCIRVEVPFVVEAKTAEPPETK